MLLKIGRIIKILILIFIQSTYGELLNINEQANFYPCAFKNGKLICDGQNMLKNSSLVFTIPTKSHITELEIINLPLVEIPDKYISALADNLLTVKIHSTAPIKRISLTAFNRCSKITSFEIKSHAIIEEKPIELNEILRDLISLEDLKLINLNVVDLKLDYLEKLKLLSFQYCNINTISFETFRNNKDLTKLHIIRLKDTSNLINQLVNWPPGIKVPINDLKLDECQLKIFPKFSNNFSESLLSLSLANNPIEKVEWNDTINLKSLQKLILTSTNLVHTSMTGLKNLNKLKLIELISIASMNDLPKEIEDMAFLESISIDMSKMENITIKLPPSVKRISASGLSKSVRISSDFLSKCNQLELLNLNHLKPGNARVLLDNVHTFRGSLKLLSLEESALLEKDLWNILISLDKLEILYLSKVNIKMIPDDVLNNLKSLQKLYLSGTPLTYSSINSMGFQSVSQHLIKLDLSRTNLTYLQPCVFYSLQNLAYVNLEHIGINCDCNLLWLLDKIPRNSSAYPSLNFTCTIGKNTGKTLYQLDQYNLKSCSQNITPCLPLKTGHYKVDFEIIHLPKESKLKIQNIKGSHLKFLFDYMELNIKQENDTFHYDIDTYVMNQTSIEINKIPEKTFTVCLALVRNKEKYRFSYNCKQKFLQSHIKQASLGLWISVSFGVTFGVLLIIIGIVLWYKRICTGKIKNQDGEYYSNCSSKYSEPDETYQNPDQYTEIIPSDEYSTDHQDSYKETTLPFRKSFSNHYTNRNIKRLTIPSQSVDGGLDISHISSNREKFHKSRSKSRNLNKRLPESASLHSLNKCDNVVPRKYQSTGRASLPYKYISRDLPIPPEHNAMQNSALPPPKPQFPSSDIKSLLNNADNHLNYFLHYTSNKSLCTDESVNQPHSGDSGLGVSKLSNHSQIRLSDNNSVII